jgi:hypothetical protein
MILSSTSQAKVLAEETSISPCGKALTFSHCIYLSLICVLRGSKSLDNIVKWVGNMGKWYVVTKIGKKWGESLRNISGSLQWWQRSSADTKHSKMISATGIAVKS